MPTTNSTIRRAAGGTARPVAITRSSTRATVHRPSQRTGANLTRSVSRSQTQIRNSKYIRRSGYAGAFGVLPAALYGGVSSNRPSSRNISPARSAWKVGSRSFGYGVAGGFAGSLAGSVIGNASGTMVAPVLGSTIGAIAGGVVGGRIGAKRAIQYRPKNGHKVNRRNSRGRGRRNVMTLRDSNGRYAGSRSI